MARWVWAHVRQAQTLKRLLYQEGDVLLISRTAFGKTTAPQKFGAEQLDVLKAIDFSGGHEPHPQQVHALKFSVYQEGDMLLISRTAFGKSIVFQLSRRWLAGPGEEQLDALKVLHPSGGHEPHPQQLSPISRLGEEQLDALKVLHPFGGHEPHLQLEGDVLLIARTVLGKGIIFQLPQATLSHQSPPLCLAGPMETQLHGCFECQFSEPEVIRMTLRELNDFTHLGACLTIKRFLMHNKGDLLLVALHWRWIWPTGKDFGDGVMFELIEDDIAFTSPASTIIFLCLSAPDEMITDCLARPLAHKSADLNSWERTGLSFSLNSADSAYTAPKTNHSHRPHRKSSLSPTLTSNLTNAIPASTAEGLRIGLDFFSDIWIPGPCNLFEGSRFTYHDDEYDFFDEQPSTSVGLTVHPTAAVAHEASTAFADGGSSDATTPKATHPAPSRKESSADKTCTVVATSVLEPAPNTKPKKAKADEVNRFIALPARLRRWNARTRRDASGCGMETGGHFGGVSAIYSTSLPSLRRPSRSSLTPKQRLFYDLMLKHHRAQLHGHRASEISSAVLVPAPLPRILPGGLRIPSSRNPNPHQPRADHCQTQQRAPAADSTTTSRGGLA
ncbi:hypothetical protein EJ06DRAFT_524645 [Trichodelitschia bisporula]|uniref:Uncharacterized protein n=1 Tax=Trichodelitschia bisporula TaxID=703511 RepID=A0A6G1HLC7_9PEZI|nr:hypothetical protein EJ06DRAFT_524645 [Trichodelitschia bisporula]